MTKTGKQRTRIAAYGLVLHQDRLLLCRTSNHLPQWAGQWTLPGGGIDFGEPPVDAMVREVQEETGLRVRATSVATVDSFFVEDDSGSFHGIRIIYNTQLVGGQLRFESDGTTDMCRWCSWDEMERLDLVDLAQIGARLARSPE